MQRNSDAVGVPLAKSYPTFPSKDFQVISNNVLKYKYEIIK